MLKFPNKNMQHSQHTFQNLILKYLDIYRAKTRIKQQKQWQLLPKKAGTAGTNGLSQPLWGLPSFSVTSALRVGAQVKPRNVLPQQLVQCSIASQHQGSINWLDHTLSQAIQIGTNTHRSTSDIWQGEDILDFFHNSYPIWAIYERNPRIGFVGPFPMATFHGF